MTPNLHFLVLQDINLKVKLLTCQTYSIFTGAMNLCWLLCWDMHTRHSYSTRPLSSVIEVLMIIFVSLCVHTQTIFCTEQVQACEAYCCNNKFLHRISGY